MGNASNAERIKAPTIRESVEEYGRGLAGGLLFSLPLLYTMEVWWTGFVSSPARLLVYIGGTFLLLLGYNRFAGLHPSADRREVFVDSVEEMGLGIVLAALVLFLTGQVSKDMPLSEVLGKISVEGMAAAIGVSVGTAQLGASGQEDGGGEAREPHFFGELVLAFCGAILIVANIAPTEEVMMIAFESTPLKILGVAFLSLAIVVVVLHHSGAGERGRLSGQTVIPGRVFAPIITYAIALLASACQLWFYGRFDGVSLNVAVAMVVTLGLGGALGASAGRLLIRR